MEGKEREERKKREGSRGESRKRETKRARGVTGGKRERELADLVAYRRSDRSPVGDSGGVFTGEEEKWGIFRYKKKM
ncbi:hypothetical protein RHGRI_023432 [Rhododendron griersonianum]|uniref:Uncharacterized protein n=1 Tax=Rhododendron griersonianum TaxID=479676 RepID=A0AAV6J3C6_9ERIC|nr:hypothetical protein RHGRI_023432 [Rhododendron griersonianum]